MAIIYKFALQLGKNQIILPEEFEILDVQDQRGVLTMWVMIPDLDYSKYKQNIYVVGTGVEFNHDSDYDHVGTVQQGNYVWHVFHATYESENVEDEEWEKQQNPTPPGSTESQPSDDPFANLRKNPAAGWPFPTR